MFRLGLIRYLIRHNFQTSTKQECGKFTGCNHYRCILKIGERMHSNNSTLNVKPLLQSEEIINHERTEHEFLIRLKNDPDSFGDSQEKVVYEEKDLREEKFFEEQPLPSQKLRTKQYADIIKSLIKKRKIKEAIDIVEVKMLQEDRVKPENYIYNLLLGACGRVGYTKKAFSLYNQMKKRGLKVTGGTYTALFNACANSPWPEDGLTRARHLQNIMIEKMYEPNETNYNAMIKAFGRCRDLSAAFQIVDEMASKKIQIKDDTINFLLQACIQDKEAGFRHALLVWRKLINKNISPSIFTYNLMLRCIRDCEIGPIEVMNETLNEILNQKPLRLSDCSNKLCLGNSNSGETKLVLAVHKASEMLTSKLAYDCLRPDLMAKVPHLGNIISIGDIRKPEDRLLLVGGLSGFLENMKENHCTPNIKTFTQLLDCLPGSLGTEKELMKLMRKLNVKPDVDFLNMLIKKRSIRFDYQSAKEVLLDIERLGYKPNVITYGVLALGCKTKGEALELLKEMKDHSYRLNTEILGAMLHQACYHKNFSYVLEMMELCLKEDVKPNKVFMECLNNFKKMCKHISNDKEHKLSRSTTFQKGFRIFQLRYKTWLEQVQVEDPEDAHPWAQFRQQTGTDTKHYKEKSDRFKDRHTSRFKVKTSNKRK